jgi:outer membrane protein TolC
LPIDLPAVLRLAGASNWGVLLAAERVREAQARWDAAKVLWVPSLNAGVGYTKHDGKIQATQGEVIDASRNSLFVGGGAVTSNSPTAGGSGGPARLFVDLSLADAIFEPLAARQLFCAERARETATFNDTLLAASLAFYDLADAQGQLAIARMDLKNSEEVRTLTEAFVAAGKGSRADVARAQVESAFRRQQVVRAEMNAKLASAELARILRLAPESLLYARDTNLVPVELVSESLDLSSLVAQGRTNRPELAENQAMVAAGLHRMWAERWRPIIPSIHVGASAGGFGGGVNDSLSFLDGRSDFDVLAVWQLRNLGFGTHAARQERSSQFRQAQLDYYRIQDLVTTEVTKAYHQVHAQRMQLSLAKENVEKALDSYRQNILRIRGLAGLPLEALQALQAVALARRAYLAALIEYNQAQLQLLRAIGQPISQ